MRDLDDHVAETAEQRWRNPWEALAVFLRDIVDSDVGSLTVHLAGTFTPTDELGSLSSRATELMGKVFSRARSARVVRPGIRATDLPMVFEQLAAVRVSDPDRTAALSRRYLALHLDATRAWRPYVVRSECGTVGCSTASTSASSRRCVPSW